MSTMTLQITLPEPLKAYVEAKVESGGYGDPADYVRELILNARDRQLAELEDHLELAMQGEAFDISDEEWESEGLIGTLREKLGQAK